MKYNHLSLYERERIFELRAKGFKVREIARKVGRDHTTISREFSRNAKHGRRYIPCIADRHARKIALRQRFRAALKNPLVFVYVREKLRVGWSPEIIAGRLSVDLPDESIHHETIYKYVYRRKNKREKLWQYLELGRKKRKIKEGRNVHKQSRIPNAASIDLRPKEAIDRQIPGHWETDNMEGKRSDVKVVSALVERTTRQISLALLPSKKSLDKNRHVIKALDKYPDLLKRSLTADNGAENTRHETVTARTGLPVFFCHPYHSWEKGTVERRIRTVRRMIPKGVSLDNYGHKDIEQIQDWVNNTPMKVLGYLTPNEKMSILLAGNNQTTSGALQDRM